MAKQYKSLHPQKYYRDYLSHNIRPDGRELDKFRSAIVNIGSISTADGSALAKIGKTTVVCGIKVELCQPRAEKPEEGFIIPNVELPPLCSPKFKPGPPSIEAQITTRLLADIIENSECVKPKELCISKEKLVWCLYVDLICLDYDGALIDVCVLALVAALKTVVLPTVHYDSEIDSIEVDEEVKKSLIVHNIPLATTFAVFDDSVMYDPTQEEEDLSSGTMTIVIKEDKELSLVHKPGGTPLSEEQMFDCIKQATLRSQQLKKLLDVVFS